MYFGTKSYLKSNRNHTAKHTLNGIINHPAKFKRLNPIEAEWSKIDI